MFFDVLRKLLCDERACAKETLEDVAKACNTSVGNLSEIETGKSLPSLELLDRLLKHYEIVLVPYGESNLRWCPLSRTSHIDLNNYILEHSLEARCIEDRCAWWDSATRKCAAAKSNVSI